MKKYFGVIGFMLLAAVLVACGGPGGTTPPEETTPPPEEVETYTVSGIVTESGDPVRAVLVRAESDEGDDVETTSANDGSWTLAGLQGEVTITAEDPAYTTDGSINLSGAASGLTFVMDLKQCNAGRVDDQDDPCVITRIQQVRDIDKYLDGFFKLGADIDASETADWNGGKGFEPIGRNIDNTPPFTGELDGDGYTINGLVIKRPDEDSIGLFGYIGVLHESPDQLGTVENLVLKNPQITGGNKVGALAGEASESFVRNVAVVGGAVEGEEVVGGLIGDTTSREIIHTSSTAIVTGESRVGGLIGDWDGGELTESFSNGIVTGNNKVGGFVGETEAGISNSYSLSKVIGVGQDPKNIGGFVGVNSGSGDITFSFSAGEVDAEDATDVHGFVDRQAQHSYWDIDITAVPSSGAGEDRSTTDMRQQATYDGWDFDDVWEIVEGEDYPNLRNNPR